MVIRRISNIYCNTEWNDVNCGKQMKWVCDHRSESQFKQLRKSPKKKRDFGASTGFEPMASALALQCSTSRSYEDPYTGGRPIYWVHQPVKGMKHRIKWCELREYKWNEYVTIAVSRNLSNCEKARKKGIRIPLKPRNPFFSDFLAIA